MKPMSYEKAVQTYYIILEDRAKMLASNIFVAIDGILDGIPADAIQDIMIEWQDERKTIIEELRNL
jgi:hypothetical protein